MKNKILISVGALLCVAAAGVVEKQFELPKAKVNVRMVDEQGAPVSGVNMRFVFAQARDANAIVNVNGVTDNKGEFTAEGYTDGVFGAYITKQGYYLGGVAIPVFRDVDALNHWKPWDATYEAVLRKVENPIPMYVRKVSAEIPAANQPCGFDLMEADWVAPYGHGKTADFVITLTNRRLDSFLDYDVSATVSFTNRLDGLQETVLPKAYATSGFKWQRQAPDSGYQASFPARASWYPQGSGKLPVRTFKDDQAYFFRVRTAESNGQIVSALYGKISGGIILEPRETKLCKIIFLYYLNPTPLDRNMEFDLTKNLFTKLKDAEKPRDP
jgi:hypothetical protein